MPKMPIVMFCLLVAGVAISLIFCCAFFIELIFNNPNRKKNKKTENSENEEELNLDKVLEDENVESSEENNEEEAQVEEEKSEEDEIDFDAMFARLEESIKKTQEDGNEEPAEEVKEEAEVVEPVEEVKPVEAEPVVAEEKKEEKPSQAIIIVNETREESSPISYEERLAKLQESLEKLEKDLAKSQKEINKYERTAKRKARNEKLLDKKAAELTNLNLVMYNVNDIKDVDPEKKQKQEELVAHIAELKQTIVDAEEYLEANKDKNANSKKLNEYLTGEKARYEEEIAELNKLIAETK